MWILMLLAGCIPPAALGVHTDGVVPAAGEVEAMVGVGAGAMEEGDGLFSDSGALRGGGLSGSVGVGSDLAVGGTIVYMGNDPGVFDLGVEARWQAVSEEEGPVNLALLLGWSVWKPSDGALHGPHLGAVASLPVGFELRPYAGLVLELLVGQDLDALPLNMQVPVGLSWRPVLTGPYDGLIMVQVLPMWTHLDGEGAYVGWGAGLALGGKLSP